MFNLHGAAHDALLPEVRPYLLLLLFGLSLEAPFSLRHLSLLQVLYRPGVSFEKPHPRKHSTSLDL